MMSAPNTATLIGPLRITVENAETCACWALQVDRAYATATRARQGRGHKYEIPQGARAESAGLAT